MVGLLGELRRRRDVGPIDQSDRSFGTCGCGAVALAGRRSRCWFPTGPKQERERETLRYILGKYEFEADARAWLAIMADPPASSDAEYVSLDGIRVHRPVWDEAMRATQVRVTSLAYTHTPWRLVCSASRIVMMFSTRLYRTASWTSRRPGR